MRHLSDSQVLKTEQNSITDDRSTIDSEEKLLPRSSSGTFPIEDKHSDRSEEDPTLFINLRKTSINSESHSRNSLYDNVPLDVHTTENSNQIMINKTAPNDVKFSFEDSIYITDLTLQEVNKNIHQRRQHSEDDDDDVYSLSSQDDIDEEVESIHSLHHLTVPSVSNMNHVKFPGMGSVDSGVPSSPVMRSPRYCYSTSVCVCLFVCVFVCVSVLVCILAYRLSG